MNESFASLLTSLSPDALTRGKQFERLVKWSLTQDPIWSRKIKNVWLWDEWPDYPGRDIGIDLVAEMTAENPDADWLRKIKSDSGPLPSPCKGDALAN